jgi:hypothetical protein
MLTENVAMYLRFVSAQLIDGDDIVSETEMLWRQMSEEERDSANYFMDTIFGEWL